jgi:hypothetical protein
MIIGVTGRTADNKIAGAGKSEVCKVLQSLLGATFYAFADPIYSMIEVGFGIDRHQSKSEPILWLSSDDKEVTLRYLLETLGTEWGRDMVHKDLWTILADRFVKACKSEYVLIDGVRFENEAKWIESQGGMIISVYRPNYFDTSPAANHPSNIALDPRYATWHFLNNEGLDELRQKVSWFVAENL